MVTDSPNQQEPIFSTRPKRGQPLISKFDDTESSRTEESRLLSYLPIPDPTNSMAADYFKICRYRPRQAMVPAFFYWCGDTWHSQPNLQETNDFSH